MESCGFEGESRIGNFGTLVAFRRHEVSCYREFRLVPVPHFNLFFNWLRLAMFKTGQDFRKHTSAILLWCVLSLCVVFCATTSQFSFYVVDDKITHAFVFGALILVLGWQALSWRKVLAVAGSLFLFGCGIELVQAFVPQRTASLNDVLANTVGLAFGCGILLLFRTQLAAELTSNRFKNGVRSRRRVL